MSKLGYDETNFTDAIVDLGRCEIETKRLNDELKLLQETIDHLKQKEEYLTNQIYILENERGIDEQLEYIERKSKTPMDKAVATEAYRDALIKLKYKNNPYSGYYYKPWHYDTSDRSRDDPKAVKGVFDKNWAEYHENRFAPGSVSYMIAKDRFEKNINKGGKTKNKKVRKQCKTKKYKRKNKNK
jgi:hypothetical protein